MSSYSTLGPYTAGEIPEQWVHAWNDVDNVDYPLVDYQVDVYYRVDRGAQVVLDDEASLFDAATGRTVVTWSAADFATDGVMAGELVVAGDGLRLVRSFQCVIRPPRGSGTVYGPAPTADLVAEGVAAHVAALDPHTGYLTTVEGTALVAAHAAEADPHPGYVTTAEGAALVAAHVAELDPHTGYAPEASPTFTGTPTVPMLKLGVLDPSGAGYAVQQATGTFEAGLYNDTTMNIGYNVSTTPGVKAVSTEPILFLQFENKFRQSPTSPYLSEFHLNFRGSSGAAGLLRPINVSIEHATDIVDMTLVGDTFKVSTSAGAQIISTTATAVYISQNLSVQAPTTTLGTGAGADTATLNVNSGATGNFQIVLQRGGTGRWLIYNGGGNDLYFRDTTNARMHLQLSVGATANTSYTVIDSNAWVRGGANEFGPTTNKLTIGSLGTTDVWVDAQGSNANVALNLRSKGTGLIASNTAHLFVGNVGFYNTTPVAKPTGVAVTAAGVHAALVTLGLIAA